MQCSVRDELLPYRVDKRVGMDICMNMIDRGYRVIEIVFGRSIEKVVEMMMMITGVFNSEN